MRELKVYEKFLMALEKDVRELLPQINQPELLNGMMAEKNLMMQEIQAIEIELSPLRKELSTLSSAGELENIEEQLISKIKETDMTIIDVISKISKNEQELTSKINEQMTIIKSRLVQINQQKNIQNKYKKSTNQFSIVNKTGEDTSYSKFDSAG